MIRTVPRDSAFQRNRSTASNPLEPEYSRRQPTITNCPLAAQHVPGMLAVLNTPEIGLQVYPWRERDHIRARLTYATLFFWGP